MLKIFKFLLRLFPGLFSIYAGMWKLGGQFINSTVKIEDIKDCASTEMVFLFYHSSGNYVYVIALTQIIGGLLLIYKKTSIIGAVICSQCKKSMKNRSRKVVDCNTSVSVV